MVWIHDDNMIQEFTNIITQNVLTVAHWVTLHARYTWCNGGQWMKIVIIINLNKIIVSLSFENQLQLPYAIYIIKTILKSWNNLLWGHSPFSANPEKHKLATQLIDATFKNKWVMCAKKYFIKTFSYKRYFNQYAMFSMAFLAGLYPAF